MPEGVEELDFRVTLDGEFEERLQVTVDCEVEPPVDDEEPVEEEPQIVPGCDTRISLKDAVVGRVLESVPAYWAPDFEKMTSPEVQIRWKHLVDVQVDEWRVPQVLLGVRICGCPLTR